MEIKDFSSESTPAEKADSKISGGWLKRWVPAAVLNRSLLLLAALCLIKLIMLWSFRQHLFEIHWRTSGEPYGWLNVAAFYVFAAILGLNLWRFAGSCSEGGAASVRRANFWILAIGVLFILLTFHEGDKNYIYMLLNNFLSVKDLRWNLILNGCFRMPFLAGWFFAYTLIYYGLVRKRREVLVLKVTAIFACLYTILCLRDLMSYRAVLIIADSFGLACLISSFPVRRVAPIFTRIALPVALLTILFFLFGSFDSRLNFTHLSPQFAILFWGSIVLFLGVTFYTWHCGFLPAWLAIFPFVFTAFFLLVNTNYPVGENYANLLCTSVTLSRYFLGELGVALAIGLAGAGYRWLSPKGKLWWMDGINLFLISLALADVRLSQIMGTRLDWDLLSLAFGETPKMMWRMAKPYLPSLIVGLLIVGGIYTVILWLIQRMSRKKAEGTIAGGEIQFVFSALILLGIAGFLLIKRDKAEGQTVTRLLETSPLLRGVSNPVMDYKTFCEKARELGIATLVLPPTNGPSGLARDLNVVLVFQESTYNKHLTLFGSPEDTQPLLSRYKERMEIFPNFFSSFTGSINARFATFTGLYPVRDFNAFTTMRVPVKSIFEVLNENGYACSLFYSSFFDYTGFRDFLRGRGFEGMYDADTMPGERKTEPVSWGLQEEETLAAMTQQIKTYAAANRKFFLTYIPAAPHNPFDGTPRQFQKYKREKMGDFSPLYRNELLYMDWVIASLVDALKDNGLLDKTLIVITADHGEMLGDDGGPIGHGWRVTPELQNVPLIIMDPAHPTFRINYSIGSQVDLMPTLLDTLNIPMPTGELFEGASLYSAKVDINRKTYINSYRQYGILQDSQFTCGDRESDVGMVMSDAHMAYSITNEGPRTVFVAAQSGDEKASSILAFDEFQENFLRNYAEYCRLKATGGQKQE